MMEWIWYRAYIRSSMQSFSSPCDSSSLRKSKAEIDYRVSQEDGQHGIDEGSRLSDAAHRYSPHEKLGTATITASTPWQPFEYIRYVTSHWDEQSTNFPLSASRILNGFPLPRIPKLKCRYHHHRLSKVRLFCDLSSRIGRSGGGNTEV
jgi:hypothetical protein